MIFSLMFLMISLQAEEVYATFNVEAQKSADLAFSSSGIVGRVFVDIGSSVKKGDTLATLQHNDLTAMLKIAQTTLKYAQKDYNRQIQVRNIIDKAKFDQYAFKYENAKAQLLYRQALLDKTILKAPFDGMIFSKKVEEGDVVSGAMIRTLFEIQSLHKRKLILEFDQKYWKNVKAGDRFTYTLDGHDKVYEGLIHKIYPAIESKERKMKAEVLAEDIVVGLFGTGTIFTEDRNNK
jgi:RND family efflux transporter MFP subunit